MKARKQETRRTHTDERCLFTLKVAVNGRAGLFVVLLVVAENRPELGHVPMGTTVHTLPKRLKIAIWNPAKKVIVP